MNRVLVALWAMLLDFQTIWIIAAVLTRDVVAIFTIFASQRNFRTNIVTSHCRAFHLLT